MGTGLVSKDDAMSPAPLPGSLVVTFDDAWWIEPVRHGRFEMGHPFLDLPNVIGSPHNSAGGGVWRDVSLHRAVANCRRALAGETPLHMIGPEERMT
jgi:phosphoglycerate dehydrogenase-like enzyme